MKCEEHNVEYEHPDADGLPGICPACLAESEARWAVTQRTPRGVAKFHGGVFDGLTIETRVIPSMLLNPVLAQAGGEQTKYGLWNVMDDGTAYYYALAEEGNV